MSAPKILIAAAVAAILGTLACVKPMFIRRMTLNEVLNRTVCPIRVVIDEDNDRVPRRIKMIMCATEPSHLCNLTHVPAHVCCNDKHGEHRMECVEMRDTVRVYSKSAKHDKTLEVSVGCSCMVGKPVDAKTPTPVGNTFPSS